MQYFNLCAIIIHMIYLKRLLEETLDHVLQRGKSVILLGARQTGKTTLLKKYLDQTAFDASYFCNIQSSSKAD